METAVEHFGQKRVQKSLKIDRFQTEIISLQT